MQTKLGTLGTLQADSRWGGWEETSQKYFVHPYFGIYNCT